MTANCENEELHFLDGLASDARDRFLAVAERNDFPPGVIFREGDQHERMHVVEIGLVQLSMHVPGRGSVPILTVGPGELLAWSAVIGAHEPVMTATAVAKEATRTRSITRVEFEQLCRSAPQTGLEIWKQISRSLSQRLVATRLQLLDLFAEQATPQTVPASFAGAREAGASSNSKIGESDAG